MAIKSGNVRLQITVSEETLSNLDTICEERGLSRSAVITTAINDMRWEQLQRKLAERRAREAIEE